MLEIDILAKEVTKAINLISAEPCKFKKGDRVRCIESTSENFLKFGLREGQAYIVSEIIFMGMHYEVILKGLESSGSWDEDRFIKL